MDLPLLAALFLAFALTLYVVLDGFDLGVGVLLLAQSDERLRDRMIDSIAPTWDGNETWLIMAGVTLLAAFPIAYGLLLPAFYLPLIVMLLALGLRGVSFEFRIHTDRFRPIWDRVFSGGSFLAAAAQGAIVGGLIEGVSIKGETFAGDPLDFLSPFSLLTAGTLVTGYATLGACWLYFKGEAGTQALVQRLAGLPLLFAALAALTCVFAAQVQSGVAAAWLEHPLLLVTLSATFIGLAFITAQQLRTGGASRHPSIPFFLSLLMFACGVVGLGLAVFPDIVPFRLSLWDAASATASLQFILVGAAVVTPIVLGYSGFAYWVFRGRTPAGGWDA